MKSDEPVAGRGHPPLFQHPRLAQFNLFASQVSQRMKDSMQDAKTTSNTGKQKALLQFAKERRRQQAVRAVARSPCLWYLCSRQGMNTPGKCVRY